MVGSSNRDVDDEDNHSDVLIRGKASCEARKLNWE